MFWLVIIYLSLVVVVVGCGCVGERVNGKRLKVRHGQKSRGACLMIWAFFFSRFIFLFAGISLVVVVVVVVPLVVSS